MAHLDRDAVLHALRGVIDPDLNQDIVTLGFVTRCDVDGGRVAVAGGVLMYVLVPDGPHLRAGARFDPTAIAAIFRSAEFRSSSFGYFGHMWELYALWAFLPAYIGASVEAGNVWDSREAVSVESLIYAGSVFVGIDSPLGPIFFGYGQAEGGNDSFYLSFGSLFGERR